MTDEDFLSQDDIDALMDGLGDKEAAAGGPAGDEVPQDATPPPPQAETMRPAVEMIIRQAATVVTTVLNKNVELGITSLSETDADSVWGSSGQYKTGCLSMNVAFVNGVTGDIFFIISKKNTAQLADLMMMGDGSAEYEDDHQDALSELGNQIMGAVCTAMGTEFGISISCDQAATQNYEEANPPFTPDGCIQAGIGMKIEDVDESEILIIISNELAESLNMHYSSTPAPAAVEDDGGGNALAEASVTSLVDAGDAGPGASRAVYSSTGNVNIDMLMDIPLDVTIELGRTNLSIRKILELGPGSIVELDRKASEPVDLMISDKVVAKGEVVVVDEYFGIRIVSLISPEERIKHLR